MILSSGIWMITTMMMTYSPLHKWIACVWSIYSLPNHMEVQFRCLVHYEIHDHKNEFKAIYKHVTIQVSDKFHYKAWKPKEYTRHLNWTSTWLGREYMLHMQAVHLCNGEYVIIIVIIHIPELKIIPSFSFIIKTWIQIAICLLKQVQVIHELMICIASTALTTMTKKWSESSFKVVHSCMLHN